MQEIRKRDIQRISSRIQDDESRFIFQCRLMHLLTGENCYLDAMLDGAGRRKGKWRTVRDVSPTLAGDDGCVIYGIGYYSRFALEQAQKEGIRVTAFCDGNAAATEHFGLPVIRPADLRKLKTPYILISSVVYRDEIYAQLTAMGISPERVLSVGAFDEQYFGNSFLRPVENEIYVDAGCYDGYSIERFSVFCKGNYRKIHGFEPVGGHFETTVARVKNLGMGDVRIHNKAVWNENAFLDFSHDGEGSRVSNLGDCKKETVTIDSAVGEDAVTLIKMDIEGAELNGLRGARETIARRRPRLAICVYHRPEDIVEIPLYCLDLVPEYKLFLRHHECDRRYFETVMYAVL